MRRRAVAAIAPLLAVLLAAGCGPKEDAGTTANGRETGTTPRAAAAESALRGMVVAVRPVPADGGVPFAVLAAPAVPRAQLRLAVAGVPAPASQALRFEFIVRVGADTLSVVQDNPDGLRPGERVDVIRAEHTRLARPT